MTSATPPDTLRAFVDGTPVSLVRGSTAADAVRQADLARAARLDAGELALTDARGLPVAPDAPLTPGTILRTVRARPAAGGRDTD